MHVASRTGEGPWAAERRLAYLVTGGSGFIGSHLVEALLARGDSVIALDNLSTGRISNLDSVKQHPRLRFVQGSVLDELMVDELTHQCDVVIHLAGAVGVKLIVEHPLRSLTTNIRGIGDRDRGRPPVSAEGAPGQHL